MSKKINKKIVVAILMVAASLLTWFLQIRLSNAPRMQAINLSTVVPSEFAQWQIDNTTTPLQVSEDMKKNLDKTYDQILSKTYFDHDGYKIMLSIAYGQSQTKALQVHKPETCYSAQGFIVSNAHDSHLTIGQQSAKVRYLIASTMGRQEPIVYWIRFGKSTTYGGVEQTIKRIQYGLKGQISDGLLFRVSSIDPDVQRAREKQKQFIQDLFSSIGNEQKEFLIGNS